MWQKLGQIYKCSGIHPKLQTHAANPLPIHLHENIFRVFYSGRDENNRSSIGAVDIDILNLEVVYDHPKPFFEHGSEGSFYSHGVSIANTYSVQGQKYMLFMGWRNDVNSHWYGEIGRLKVNNDLSLELDSDTPLMALDVTDPISLSYPWVLQEQNIFKMWYGSTVSWDAGNGEMLHVIKYAESKDGHNWVKRDFPLPHQIGVAQAFSRPSVIRFSDGKYRMWYSVRSGDGTSYRIDSSFSEDGLVWQKQAKECSPGVSKTAWDSEMIEYPFVFRSNEKTYMLYNGNDYGKTGFGIAVLKK